MAKAERDWARSGASADPLLNQTTGEMASFTGNGEYDQGRVPASVAEYSPEAAVSLGAAMDRGGTITAAAG